MRNPARIDAMIDLLSAAWKRNPDLRLGQLLLQAAIKPPACNPYYIEDDDLLDRLKEIQDV